MSYDKESKTNKRHADQVAVNKQLRIRNHYYDTNPKAPGKFRKQKALNCGNAGCMMCCNPRRTWGHLTIKEVAANAAFKQELNDVSVSQWQADA